jgi:hypothetical protein
VLAESCGYKAVISAHKIRHIVRLARIAVDDRVSGYNFVTIKFRFRYLNSILFEAR